VRRLVCSALLAAISACGRGGAADAPAADPASDARVAALFANCSRTEHYDRNLADVAALLTEKLGAAEPDALKRAKEELAAMGSAAIPPVRRFLEQHYSDPLDVPYVSNAIDVLKQSSAPEAHDVLLRCLQHPGDSVRLGAIQGLSLQHARPEDFDVLLTHLDLEVAEQRHQVAMALFAADPARAEALYLDWIERGERGELWRFVALFLARSARAETGARAARLYAAAPLEIRAFLAVSAARAGDQGALAFLRGELDPHAEGANPERRLRAISAASEAQIAELLVAALNDDPGAKPRAVAASGLARLADDERVRAALLAGLDDSSTEVRGLCLDELVRRGEPAAIDRALLQLQETPASLQEALGALLQRMPEDAELARRVLAALLARDELESFLPLEKRLVTLKAIGQVPLAEAAGHLLGLARKHSDETIDRLRAHEWLMIQAANTGDAGRAFLRGELAAERDPARRLDLLWASSASRSDATRQGVLALLEGSELSPMELLYLCDQAARLGPAAEMAPRLKRIANRVEDQRVRLALNCLLWRWY
jgi:hypothetical protein